MQRNLAQAALAQEVADLHRVDIRLLRLGARGLVLHDGLALLQRHVDREVAVGEAHLVLEALRHACGTEGGCESGGEGWGQRVSSREGRRMAAEQARAFNYQPVGIVEFEVSVG